MLLIYKTTILEHFTFEKNKESILLFIFTKLNVVTVYLLETWYNLSVMQLDLNLLLKVSLVDMFVLHWLDLLVGQRYLLNLLTSRRYFLNILASL